MGEVVLEEQASPGAGVTDKVKIYPKAGGQLYKMSDDGNEFLLVDEENLVRQNLLTNPGFGVCSNSTLEDVRNLPDATTTVSGTTCTSTAHLLTKGMLVTDDTDAVFEAVSITSADIFEVDRTGASSGTQWQEVTPGFVAANALAPDGWAKRTNTHCWREYSGSNTKAGSFYALKILSSGNSTTEVYYPSIAMRSSEEWLDRVRGRTVTLGTWVKTDAASQVKLNIYDDTEYFSSLNTGAEWEWLEVTRTVGLSCARFDVGFYVTSGKTAYISQSTLVFGSSIGEGNYSRPPGEMVNLESATMLTNFNATGYTTTARTAINMETESNGKIGKGAIGYNLFFEILDSVPADGQFLFLFGFDSGAADFAAGVRLHGNDSADVWRSGSSYVPASASGNIDFQCVASGALTMDIRIKVISVHLR